MELTLSDEQSFFAETTRRFLADKVPRPEIRLLRDSRNGFDQDYWRQGAELGWVSLLVPENLGGGSVSGRGVVDLTIVADAFGRAVAPGPLIPANIVAAALAARGTPEHRDHVLPALVSGHRICTWVAGRLTGSGMRCGVTAAVDGRDYRLTGVEAPVEYGAQADTLLVTAALGDRLAQFLIAVDEPGIRVHQLEGIDMSRRFARIEFDNVRATPESFVGVPGDAFDDVERQLQLTAVMQTAELCGAAGAIFDMTLEWTFDRYSFGRPLASYQAIKHRFADMKMWLEASHALAAATVREVEQGDATAGETASIAKAYLGERLPELAEDCTQLHGGIGVTFEHDIHMFLRRITVDSVTYGSVADHRQRIVSYREAAA